MMQNSDLIAANPPRTQKEKKLRALRFFAVYSLLAILLYFALRNAPLEEIWNTLRQLQFWQIAILFGLNLFIYALITLRWWIIVRAENKFVAYVPLLLVRIAVFGVSYFTLGPHIGGEPLQVFHLQRKYKLTYTRATASVIMDKLLELLANFFLLALGLTAIFQARILSTSGSNLWLSLIGLVILCIWPPVHVILLYKQTYPLSALLRNIPFIKKDSRAVRFIAVRLAEREVATALDACLICGDKGYAQDGASILCLHCASVIHPPTIGQPGGCNPIPLPARIEGDLLVIDFADLASGARHFGGGGGHAAHAGEGAKAFAPGS